MDNEAKVTRPARPEGQTGIPVFVRKFDDRGQNEARITSTRLCKATSSPSLQATESCAMETMLEAILLKHVIEKAVLTLYNPGLFSHCRLLLPPPRIALLSIISWDDFRVSPVSTVVWDADSSTLPPLLAAILFCFSQSVTTTAGEAPLLLLGEGGWYTDRVKRAERNTQYPISVSHAVTIRELK